MLAAFPRGARPVGAVMFLIGKGNRVAGGFMIRLPRFFFRIVPGPDSVRFRFFRGTGVPTDGSPVNLPDAAAGKRMTLLNPVRFPDVRTGLFAPGRSGRL